MPTPKTILPDLFSALGDPTRLAIVERLMREGELPAGRIGADFPISAPAVSRHLDVLLRATVVDRRVSAQSRIYRVRPEAIEAIFAWTTSHRDFWETRLRRLDQALKTEMTRK